MHFRLLVAAGLALAALLSPVRAHEGHDHEQTPAMPAGTAAVRGEASSDTFELVASLRDGQLVVHVDRFATNEPVAEASIEAETPSGPVTLTAGPAGDFRAPAPWAGNPGRKDLIFTVTAGGDVDVLPVTIDVPVPEEAHAAAGGSAGLLASAKAFVGRLGASRDLAAAGGLGFLGGLLVMALLRRRRSVVVLLGLFVLVAGAGEGVRAHEGHDHGPPAGAAAPSGDLSRRLADGAVFMPKPTQRLLAIRTMIAEAASHRRVVELPARVIPDPNASGYVQASAGGRLQPPPGGFPRLGTRVSAGDVLASVVPPLQAIDRSDMRQRQGELDQAIAVAERRILRFEQLARTGAGTQVQLDEAKLELQGLRDRRAALDQARREPEPLVAPVPGTIAEVSAIAGQMIQPSTVVFQIVDPARLWLEALTFEPVARLGESSARTSTGASLALRYQGSGLAARGQAVPIHFSVEAAPQGLRLGQFVTVLAPLDEDIRGIAVPRAAVVRAANGQNVVYVHRGAERFEPRQVRVRPLDGERTLIEAGVDPGERVVTQGAELVDQVR